MESVIYREKSQDYFTKEAFKALRTNIQFCGEDKKVIALTSCIPNEGKSTVSFNLAVSMAEAGKKVLFIDADLRKSVLAGKIQVNGQMKGLAHYLSRQASLQEVIHKVDVSNLHLVIAGPVSPNPTELLGGELFKDLIAVARQVYDYVIIDTPPLGSVIDSVVIAGDCDGAILIIESGSISYRFAQNVKKQLEKSNCNILGAILNKVDITAKGKYGKYGKYYKKEYA
jgi:capsular exopolysaccharide family